MYITKNRRPATAEGEKYAAYQKYTYDRPNIRELNNKITELSAALRRYEESLRFYTSSAQQKKYYSKTNN